MGDAYDALRHNLEHSYSLSDFDKLPIQPLFLDEEAAIEDLAALIRAIRPHLPKSASAKLKLTARAKKALEEGNKTLKEVALLDAAYQWRDLGDNQEFRTAYKKFLVKGVPSSETNVSGEEKKPTPPKSSTSNGKKKSKSKKKSSKKKEKIAPLQESAQEEKKVNPSDESSEQPAPVILKKEEKPENITFPQDKEKTRPSESALFFQSLNGLFEDEPAVKKAERKLEAQPLPSENTVSIPIIYEEHTRRLKVLEDILYSENTAAIDVDKTLNLLEYFGFIESGSKHKKMKAKPIELWLNGERTLIDLPPAITVAISHKSGGERYFKPYVVQNIRAALFKAGFDKLLKK